MRRIIGIGILVILLAGCTQTTSRVQTSPTPHSSSSPSPIPEIAKSIPSPSKLYTYNLHLLEYPNCELEITDKNGNTVDLSFMKEETLTTCEITEGIWSSTFYTWVTDSQFLLSNRGKIFRADLEKKNLTQMTMNYDTNRYSFARINKDGSRVLLRDLNYKTKAAGKPNNKYSIMNEKGNEVTTIFSSAYPEETFYDPNNDLFLFTEMTWPQQFELKSLKLKAYNLNNNSEKEIYTTPETFTHRGACSVGNLTSEKGKITFTVTELYTASCFEEDPKYKNNGITIEL